MLLVGFGYYFTFLAKYGVGAIAFTYLVTMIAFQWSIFTQGFFSNAYSGHWDYITISMRTSIDFLYSAFAVLITFACLIGKISPLQLIVVALIEIVFYSVNKEVLLLGVYNIHDCGSTIIIHCFGAYFGLSVAYILGPPNVPIVKGYSNDTLALLGTIFMWIFWPCFVAGELPQQQPEVQFAVIHTLIALVSSTVV